MQRTLGGSLILLLAACQASDNTDNTSAPTIVEHPNGMRSVSYNSVEPEPHHQLVEDLRIGTASGSPDETFGEIRAFSIDSDGNVYVLDGQAQDVRVFDPNGSYLRRIVRRGRGPAEIEGANGLFVDSDNTVWLNDPGNGRYMHVDTDGNELKTVKRQMTQYRYTWVGGVDRSGWVWEHVQHGIEDDAILSEGILHHRSFFFSKGFGPAGEVDSILLADARGTSIRLPRGFADMPFAPEHLVVFDLTDGFWITSGATYDVVHVNISGDTTLSISNTAPPVPVSDSAFQARMERLDQFMERAGRVDVDGSAIPRTYPTITQIIPDRSGGVWVRRPSDKALFLVDRYDATGMYLGSAACDARIPLYYTALAVGDVLYAITLGDMDVPYVVRYRLGAMGENDGLR